VGSSLSASYNRKQINCTKNFTDNAITNSSYLLCYRYHGEGEDVATGFDQIHHLLVGGALYVHPITANTIITLTISNKPLTINTMQMINRLVVRLGRPWCLLNPSKRDILIYIGLINYSIRGKQLDIPLVQLKCNVPMNLVTQHVAGQNDRLLATSVLFVLEK
jgi:hypothetical protein